MSNDKPLQIPDRLRIQLSDGQVETMFLDEYLKGVVPTEMGLAKPLEALKAQAIAARSYAVTTRRHALEGFDLCTTTHCQVWKPKNRYPDSDRAVDETSGQVVTYNGQVVAAHFFAHCDGHTRNSEDVWSGKVAYYRSVPCICGYTTLFGHGVGMCQRGAAAMAAQGDSVIDILTHYYTGIQVAQATAVPRSSVRDSVIFGQVLDLSGQPHGGERLILEGAAGRLNRGTTAEGKFWFTSLPAGRWMLSVKGKAVHYGDLFTDGRSSVQIEVIVPGDEKPDLAMAPLDGPLRVAGSLGRDGVPLTLVDDRGNERTVLSGSAPAHNPGGFEIPVPAPGSYALRVLGQSFLLEISASALWLEFGLPA